VLLHSLRVNAVINSATVLQPLQVSAALAGGCACLCAGTNVMAGSRQAAWAGSCLFQTGIFVPLDGLVLTRISFLPTSLITAQMLFAVVQGSVSR